MASIGDFYDNHCIGICSAMDKKWILLLTTLYVFFMGSP